MGLGGMLLMVSIAAPGILAVHRMIRDGISPILAAATGVLMSTLWSIGVVLILTTVRDSAIPEPLWVGLITATMLVEVLARPRHHGLR